MLDLKDILKPNVIEILKEQDYVFICLETKFEKKLDAFLPQFEKVRLAENKNPYIQPSYYPSLPFGQKGFEWNWRKQSLKIIEKLLSNTSPVKILEVGSWNGWLTNRLVEMGHNVLATDYFLDDRDGLQCQKYYKNKWTSLQMYLANPEIFAPGVFDVIIINHGLQFLPDPMDYIRQIKPLLTKNGKIILLGLSFYKDPGKKAEEVKISRRNFEDKYGFKMTIHPSKGYLDFDDKDLLKKEGFILKQYNGMILRNSRAKFFPQKPGYYFGLFENDKRANS